MSFPWEARIPVNTGTGRQTETKNKVAGPGRESVSKSMSTVSGGDRKVGTYRGKDLTFSYLSQLLT
jgi:hypothetical protein